jgi:hypothetical protein
MWPRWSRHNINLELFHIMNAPAQNPAPGSPNAQSPNLTNSTKTYRVGCKLPAGFLMELGSVDSDNYRCHKLNGLNTTRIAAVDGFGITEGVPADFFDAWEKKMKGFKMFKNGLIFKVASKDVDSFEAVAKEMRKQKTGMEPLTRRAAKDVKDQTKAVVTAEF